MQLMGVMLILGYNAALTLYFNISTYGQLATTTTATTPTPMTWKTSLRTPNICITSATIPSVLLLLALINLLHTSIHNQFLHVNTRGL